MKFVYGYFPVPNLAISAFNGATSVGGTYKIGIARLLPGAVWDTSGISNPILGPGSGWEAGYVKDPCLFYANGQYNMLYDGADVSNNFQVGLATATNYAGPWTKYASNPVLIKGTTGDPDVGGTAFPCPILDGTTLRVWYCGAPGSGISSTGNVICYAESTDYGKTFTKHGQVIGEGTAGSFSDLGVVPGFAFKSGSTFYVYFGGLHNYGGAFPYYRSAYCTCTDPSNPATYSAPVQLSNYSSPITLAGHTWDSNLPRSIIPVNNGYLATLDLFHPDNTTSIESSAMVPSPDLTSWNSPTSLAIPFDSWDSGSAENPYMIVPPK